MIKVVFCAPVELTTKAPALTDLLEDLDLRGSAEHDQPLGMHRLTLTVDSLSVPQEQRLRTRAASLAAELGLAHAVLIDALAEAGPGLIVSDVDSTLITAEVIELIAEGAGSRESVAAITERAMRGEIDFSTSLRDRVATLAGLDVAALGKVREQVELSPGASELIAAANATGCLVALVSGGFAEIVEPLAGNLGITLVRANRLEVHHGHLTGRTVGPVVDAAAKAEQLVSYAREHKIPLDRVVAVGDGANDLEMMAAAELGIAYCAKPIVRQQADGSIPFPRLDAVAALTGLV